MYKLQMKFQRIISYLCIAAAALTFIYSLGCMTDVYFLYKIEVLNYEIPGADMFYDMQPFNKTFTTVSVLLILLSVAGLVFNNHTRRKYYLVNYALISVTSVSNIIAAIWGYVNIFKYKEMFLNVEFEVIQDIVDTVPEAVLIQNGIDPANLSGPYSTFWFDISILVFAVLVVVSLLNVVNMLWKAALMHGEKKALKKGAK